MSRRKWPFIAWLAVPALVLLQFTVPVLTGSVSPAAAATPATPGRMTLRVESALSGAHPDPQTPILHYKWLISAEHTNGAYGYAPGQSGNAAYDATGDATNDATSFARCTPGVPTSASAFPNVASGQYDPMACQWPSVRYTPGAVPVVAQGDETDFAPGSNGYATKDFGDLAPGRYLVSVTAPGYRIDGAHFDVDGSKGTSNVVVSMHAYPVPTGTLRLRVFADTAPVDGTYEVGVEKPLAGFTVHLNDVLGEVTTDWFGNRLCTNYVHVTAADQASYPGQKVGDVALDPVSGSPVIDVTNPGGTCRSDASGDVAIPNLGPDRYTATVIAPTGQQWYQTTTLEGNHDWDMWIAEAESGFDTEQTVGNEPVPPVDMGFVPFNPAAGQPDSGPRPFASSHPGSISGTVVEINTYVGGSGGVNVPNAGVAGANVRGPVSQPIVALSDLDNNDQLVYVGRGGTDGTFSIAHVPDGNYQLTLWDYPQDLILDSYNVTVSNGQAVKLGQKGLVDWYTDIRGTVFVDSNGNGVQDPGEPGIPKFPITLKERDNSLLDAGQNAATTDDQGHYDIREGYPISKFLVLEAFDTRYKTTGITVQADNESSPTTYRGSAVDVNVEAVIGLSGRVDWGVQPYAGKENGGIVGTVTYDTTRNELDPKYAVTEGYQPGIPGLTVHLYAPVACAAGDTPPGYAAAGAVCGTDGYWHNADGSILPASDSSGTPIDQSAPYTSETWQQPTGCTARQHDGSPLTDQYALPPFPGSTPGLPNNAAVTDSTYPCVEAPMLGWYAKPADTTTDAFAQTVNGNYGFNTVYTDPTNPAAGTKPMPNGNYIVKVDIPQNPVGGKPMYEVTKEEDVNIFDGDARLPQENFPLPAGYTPPDPAPMPANGGPVSQQPGIWSDCVGANHTVDVTDSAFLAGGGSPFQGQARHLCDEKLVNVRGGQSVSPNFNLFTPVPLPTHFWGLTINDLGLSQDKTQANYGEAQPLPNVPMGIYDWSGRLVDTVTTDWNGMYEALEPSTSSYNCPLPAGPCPGMYYFKGNDPGQPGHVNANYNPRFRTIGTEFQAWPGLWTTTDTAPTQVGVIAVAPGSTQINPVQCDVNAGTTGSSGARQYSQLTPDLMAIDRPYLTAAQRTSAAASDRTLTLTGDGFGQNSAPTVSLRAPGAASAVSGISVSSWSMHSITFVVPRNVTSGPLQLSITNNDSGRTSVNGLTLHVFNPNGSTAAPLYNPRLIQVNPPSAVAGYSSRGGAANALLNLPSAAFPAVTNGDPNTTPENVLQRAVDIAAGFTQALVVVWPNAAVTNNPTGDYFENLVVHSPVKLQGVGPGGIYTDASGSQQTVAGSRINGLGFNPDNVAGANWVATVARVTTANVPDAAVVTVLGSNRFGSGFTAALDGLTITGGSQSDFATALNAIYGNAKTPAGAPNALVTQGGGIYLHGQANYLQVSNNVVVGNSGSYGGGIRIGTPYLAQETSANVWTVPATAVNDHVTVTHNRIRDNGGTNLAGGIGVFDGANNYSIDHNDLCGNFSAEYGGGISHYGLSNNGLIQANRVYLNSSYDEGGGIMMAGELNPNLSQPSAGASNAGIIRIDANQVTDNLANDDGGGIRFLTAGRREIDVTNNIVADNISTHEGGGIALDDSTEVHITGNTVMKNLTTATAVTSNGQPAPAGLSTGANSDQLQALLPRGTAANPTPLYSKPQDFRDNIFWGNLAGRWDPASGKVLGIDPTSPATDPKNEWDLGSVDPLQAHYGTAGTVVASPLTPTYSVLYQNEAQVTSSPTNRVGAAANFPQVVNPYDVSVQIITSRTFPSFREAAIVAHAVAPNVQGNYHLAGGTSPAGNSGGSIGATTSNGSVAASIWASLGFDVDHQARNRAALDVGADEIP